jgi:hypothetical protein
MIRQMALFPTVETRMTSSLR